MPQEGDRDTTRICDLRFHEDAENQLFKETKKFPALKNIQETDRHLADLFKTAGTTPPIILLQNVNRNVAHAWFQAGGYSLKLIKYRLSN